MGDAIYIVDPKTKKPARVSPVSFGDLGVRERADLEAWVINHPELLGEALLIITSEYSKFDKSERRLDVLALDKAGSLVVVELKLDISATLADQQAIRYAAFCSTLTMEQLVGLYADYYSCTKDDAEQTIISFLEREDLPELNDRPRIILAAGSIEDQELTSCVLWLRKFGVDISCVEMTPYRLPDSQQLVLVPRIIIPLPEAKEFVVKAEQKEAKKARDEKTKSETEDLWRAIAEEFNKLGTDFHASGRSRGNYMKVHIGNAHVHYEWFMRKGEQCLDVALHFESADLRRNQEMLAPFSAAKGAIEKDTDFEFKTGDFGRKWKQARFSIPYNGSEPISEIARKAATLMKTLIDRTWQMVEKLKHEE